MREALIGQNSCTGMHTGLETEWFIALSRLINQLSCVELVSQQNIRKENEMYTILVNDDNSLLASIRARIIQGSKNIDYLRFLINPTYNDIDMSELSVILTYILPVSKERKTLTLEKSEELYKERLEYKVLLNNDENFITSEYGDVKMWLTFMNDGDIVRYTTPTFLPIIRAEDTSDIPEPPESQNVDSLYLDKNTKSIYLTAGGSTVGAAIPMKDLSDAIVESSNDGLIAVVTD